MRATHTLLLALPACFVLILGVLVAARRHLPGQRGHRNAITGEPGATIPAYLIATDASPCGDGGASTGGCDGGGGSD